MRLKALVPSSTLCAFIATGKLPLVGGYMLPYPFLVMLVIAVLAGVLLNFTVFGRYLLALGRNEQALRYSGINTDRMIIWAYVICSTLAGLGGILFSLDINSVQPSGYGNFYELYAIAAAVLGGCSLREGSKAQFWCGDWHGRDAAVEQFDQPAGHSQPIRIRNHRCRHSGGRTGRRQRSNAGPRHVAAVRFAKNDEL